MNKTSAVQTIGILTSGGDAPGMNAALHVISFHVVVQLYLLQDVKNLNS